MGWGWGGVGGFDRHVCACLRDGAHLLAKARARVELGAQLLTQQRRRRVRRLRISLSLRTRRRIERCRMLTDALAGTRRRESDHLLTGGGRYTPGGGRRRKDCHGLLALGGGGRQPACGRNGCKCDTGAMESGAMESGAMENGCDTGEQ